MSHRCRFHHCLLLLVLILAGSAFAEWKEKVLYGFQGGPSDGCWPAGGVVFDKAGNLYGATTGGGPANCLPIGSECGSVFELSPPARKGDPWTETILYQFKGKGSNDGSVPSGGVILDTAGNLYGVTAYGGTGNCNIGVSAGCGTVYELSPPAKKGDPWTETILHSFTSGKDGYFPWGTLTFDANGNLYGGTQFGGGKGNTCNIFYAYCGTVFELSPVKKGGEWKEKVLHCFAGGDDGANPNGGLTLGKGGEIYGTTFSGGNQGCGTNYSVGCGSVFTLTPPTRSGSQWREEVLTRFNGQDGGLPEASVILGTSNDLYGTTLGGGSFGYGAIFEVVKVTGGYDAWEERVLHSFDSTGDGGKNPMGRLTFGADGNLYGTTPYGVGAEQYGSVFRIKPPQGKGWAIDYLHGFLNAHDGAFPEASVTFDGYGNLYGTTQEGGSGAACGYGGCGTVFEVSPNQRPD